MFDIVVEDTRWDQLDLVELCARAWSGTRRRLDIGVDHSATVMACDDATILKLNHQFRGKKAATNVLSWPQESLASDEEGGMPMSPRNTELGDIALAFETSAKEAEGLGLTHSDHCLHLIVHGLLHLLGYDHENDADAALMESIEVQVLETLGVADPYGDHADAASKI